MTARSIGDIAVAYAARRNNPVRRNSYDLEDPRAKVFRKIGDGSAAQGFAHTGALRETLKALIKQQRQEGYEGADRLQRSDYFVFDAMLSLLNFATGELFPSQATIAAKAGVCRQVVIDAIKRLQAHGFIEWVRRSIRNEDDDGPTRKQTSNAYYFDHRRRMAKRVWQTFLHALTRNLRKLGSAPPTQPPAPPKAANPALEAALARLGDAVETRSRPSP